MKLTIQRYCIRREPHNVDQTFDVDAAEGATLLEILQQIKTTLDPTLTFSSGCRSGVCGSCALRVNGQEKLACTYKPSEGDRIEPLRYLPVIKDLVVDAHGALETLSQSHSWLSEHGSECRMTQVEEKRIEVQSDCILCSSCYSACPVIEVNGNFLGPFALTRVWRYEADVRENEARSKIDAVQGNGIWDCTLCGECTLACPQGIDPKSDIQMLRSKSTQFGYSDPNAAAFGSFGLDF